MSIRSNNIGRAYEYAWMITLYRTLSALRKTRIANNSSFYVNKRAWETVGKNTQELFQISANSAVNTILELEPRIVEDDGREILLEFQSDDVGTKGDVRDIVIKRNDIQWEFGLSIKHNHEAVKHSRLSHSLDFGKEWFGIPCTAQYWEDVSPIFNRLKVEKVQGNKWSLLPDKENGIYIPLLRAFINEVGRAYKADTSMPQKMVEYLIGIKDYYKVVSHDQQQMTLIHTFNMHNTLNKPSKIKVSSINVPVVELPTELVAIKLKTRSNNTVEMYLNNGWQLSFRIHNASTYVEPSLKFDVQFIGMPVSILNIECNWINNK